MRRHHVLGHGHELGGVLFLLQSTDEQNHRAIAPRPEVRRDRIEREGSERLGIHRVRQHDRPPGSDTGILDQSAVEVGRDQHAADPRRREVAVHQWQFRARIMAFGQHRCADVRCLDEFHELRKIGHRDEIPVAAEQLDHRGLRMRHVHEGMVLQVRRPLVEPLGEQDFRRHANLRQGTDALKQCGFDATEPAEAPDEEDPHHSTPWRASRKRARSAAGSIAPIPWRRSSSGGVSGRFTPSTAVTAACTPASWRMASAVWS